MTGALKVFGGALAVVVLLFVGLYAYRSLMRWNGRTPEGYQVLTAVPGSPGFEPSPMPSAPVLENQATSDLAVNFGYRIESVPYSYSLVLSFAPQQDKGHATATVRHAKQTASVQVPVVRRWDEPRHAYAVALENRFDLHPAVPSLCIKAVIGPSLAGYDLKDASICVAQRDAAGSCRPQTLACGQIRQ